jgi:serine/threonine protein kinase/tetratricopeptide (TPR) repeat protein
LPFRTEALGNDACYGGFVIGRQVSHFYVIRILGSGGMGVVYEAQDTRLPRSVAIKMLKPALSRNVDAIMRFKREARLASSLNHPNICTILDVDEGEGQSFIAMELLQGRSLKSRLAEGPLPLDEILVIASQVAGALAAAHDQGVMHRDITPGNIFLTDGGLAKLLDFGLAKHFPGVEAADQLSDELTTDGAVAGTVHYMAPERFDSGAVVDYRCDLFSLGAVLYQMATGARPFEAASRSDVIAHIQDQPHVPLRSLAPSRPEALARIVDLLLSKRPEERYATAWALRADVDALAQLTQPTVAPIVSGRSRGTRERMSVAVLPFEIVGERGPNDEHFRDGLAEDIRSRLSAVAGLRVAPRTSTRPHPGESIRELGERLNVETVLEGSVQQSNRHVRVLATLVAAVEERAVRPAIRVDRPFEDLLQVQDEVALAVAHGVSAAFTEGREALPTHDPEAFHAYKRGQHHWKSCFTGGWRPAIEQFQQAVDRDPRFAPAHVALANAYNFLGFYCLMKPSLAFGVAARAAERALAIDARQAAAHTELALSRFGGDWDWESSEQGFRRSLEIDPASPLTHIYYSWLLMLLGREDAAVAEAQAGHSLAPGSRLVSAGRAQTLYLGGRYDEAADLCTECLLTAPDYVFARHLRGLCLLARRKSLEAIADLEHAATLTGRTPFYVGILGLCYGRCGMRDRALGLVDELTLLARDSYVPPQAYVFIHAGLGEHAQALAHQERAYEDGASPFNYLTPTVRELYALDPHHKSRLEQMRLAV